MSFDAFMTALVLLLCAVILGGVAAHDQLVIKPMRLQCESAGNVWVGKCVGAPNDRREKL